VDWSGKPPLRPFGKVDELIERSIDCLARLDPSFGESLAILQEMGHLDLDSRPAKSPGGYNMPLHFTGVPFIFMNASQSIRDVQTLMHETGHAVHSLLTREYELNSAKQPTPEIAELASMTM
ncbi:MAG: M3 family oligoendopeptidase, partial [Saprospiraceae bacterium]|nr:M3 family oligoendopeptidase [Saprospiraceae bacterium]